MKYNLINLVNHSAKLSIISTRRIVEKQGI